jgi:hypothetical protein
MKRRGFLKMLGAIGVAAPCVKKAVSKPDDYLVDIPGDIYGVDEFSEKVGEAKANFIQAKLKIDGEEVGCVSSVQGPEIKCEIVDFTNLQSPFGYHERRPVTTSGEIKIEVTGNISEMFCSGEHEFELTMPFPTDTQIRFKGYIRDCEVTIVEGSPGICALNVDITGAIEMT